MYAFYRMLSLFNFPFTTGRRLNWFTEIEPVASERLRQMVNVTEGIGFMTKGARLHKWYRTYNEYVGYREQSVPQITVWQMRFDCGVLGQVWYLISSIPDLCLLTYFHIKKPEPGIILCFTLQTCDYDAIFFYFCV